MPVVVALSAKPDALSARLATVAKATSRPAVLVAGAPMWSGSMVKFCRAKAMAAVVTSLILVLVFAVMVEQFPREAMRAIALLAAADGLLLLFPPTATR